MNAKAVVVACVVCAWSGTVRADEHAEAKQHYARAIELIKAGSHREAIVEFEHAYLLAKLPNILFNIAQEHRSLAATGEPQQKLDDLDQAIAFYRRYLDARKDAPDLLDVEKAIADLQAALPAAHRAAARAHYVRAVELIQNDQHREAIAEFQHAYELAPLPNILFNLAREYHALGDSGGEAAMSEVPDMEKAVQYYQQYLAGRKDAPDRRDVEHAIAGLQSRIDRALHPHALDRPPQIVVARPQPAAVRSFDENEESAPSVRRGRALTVAGVALLAVGALVAAGGAVGLAVDRPNPTADRDFVFSFGGGTGISSVASPLQPLYIAAIAVGGVAAIAGVVLIALGTRREKATRQATLQVAPLVGGNMAGAFLQGSF